MAAGYAVACTAGLVATSTLLRRRLGWRPGVLGHHLRLLGAFLPGAYLSLWAAHLCTGRFGTGLAGDAAGLLLGGAALLAPAVVLARPLGLALRPRRS
jgi:putative peptidoglycan lipid II flippase